MRCWVNENDNDSDDDSDDDNDNDSDSFIFEHGLDGYNGCSELRFWLEASTLSNRGEMRQHLPTDYAHAPTAGWKPVPR